MTNLTTNDNQPARTRDTGRPDAMGQASLLLVESLIHGLVARSVISVGDAVEIVEVATEVKREYAEEMGDTEAEMEKSLALLGKIHLSLRQDLISPSTAR